MRGTEVRRSTAARPPSGLLTGTSSRSEPELLIGRCGGTSVFLGRRVFGPGKCVLGNESALEPVKMFGAVRGYASRAPASRSAETVPAAVSRTVKLSTSYFLAEKFLSPSEVRPLDG